MFHERISAWNKMIAKFRWHYIPVCSLVGHGCILLQQLIDIMFASDTGLESESQNYDDTEQSNENDNTTDVVYEDEADDETNF